MASTTTAPDLKRGDTATVTTTGEQVTIVRAEWLDHPAFGTTPARRERWLHVRFTEDGGRLLMHPSALMGA